MTTLSTFDFLKSRGMIEQVSNENAIKSLLSQTGIPIYVGFDPTAPTLHIGHLLPIMVLAHLQRSGHRPIVVVGGATGMVGDPSGRSTERQLLTPEVVAENVKGIQTQLEKFVSFDGASAAILVDNSEWIHPITYIDWLRNVGKYFTINSMLAKESVRRRLEDREQGISYTEFSYMLLQAYDFLHLHDRYGCMIQGGGNDQWGNITAGIELVRKVRGTEVFGITFPLITTANGEKFGKSAGNAVWLDATKTSPYQFYQFWLNSDDRDVERYLNLFTFLDSEKIATCCEAHQKAPELREAQKLLASEVTRTVHGEDNLQKAVRASQILFGKEIAGFSDRELSEIFADVPSTEMPINRLEDGLPLVDLLVETELCSSKSEARRLIQGLGAYLNNQSVNSTDVILTPTNLASETVMVLRTGKKNYHLVNFK